MMKLSSGQKTFPHTAYLEFLPTEACHIAVAANWAILQKISAFDSLGVNAKHLLSKEPVIFPRFPLPVTYMVFKATV